MEVACRSIQNVEGLDLEDEVRQLQDCLEKLSWPGPRCDALRERLLAVLQDSYSKESDFEAALLSALHGTLGGGEPIDLGNRGSVTFESQVSAGRLELGEDCTSYGISDKSRSDVSVVRKDTRGVRTLLGSIELKLLGALSKVREGALYDVLDSPIGQALGYSVALQMPSLERARISYDKVVTAVLCCKRSERKHIEEVFAVLVEMPVPKFGQRWLFECHSVGPSNELIAGVLVRVLREALGLLEPTEPMIGLPRMLGKLPEVLAAELWATPWSHTPPLVTQGALFKVTWGAVQKLCQSPTLDQGWQCTALTVPSNTACVLKIRPPLMRSLVGARSFREAHFCARVASIDLHPLVFSACCGSATLTVTRMLDGWRNLERGDIVAAPSALDGVLRQLSQLLGCGVTHADLRFSNIFFSPELTDAKLIDFESLTCRPAPARFYVSGGTFDVPLLAESLLDYTAWQLSLLLHAAVAPTWHSAGDESLKAHLGWLRSTENGCKSAGCRRLLRAALHGETGRCPDHELTVSNFFESAQAAVQELATAAQLEVPAPPNKRRRC